MQNIEPLISFIMPNFNNEHVLDLFFQKLYQNNTYENYELIVTDDGSTDNSLELLYKWQKSGKFRNFKIIAEPHKGIINALNKCLYAAKGDFIIRLDGDATIESKSFVEKFLEFYNVSPDKIGVITSKVIDDKNILHALGRNVISEKGLHNRGYVISEEVGNRTFDGGILLDKKLNEYIDMPAECDTALGVCTFSDRETALKIGGFDYNYPLWIEDDDFYLAYRLHNKKCFYLPSVRICHRFSLRGSRKTAKNIFELKKFKQYIDKTFQNTLKTLCFLNVFIFNKICFSILYKNFDFKIETNPWRINILKHDYKYWKSKWGFDVLNPDMNIVKEKYKNTEILWNYDEKMRQDGIDIINKYLSLKKL